MAPTPEHEPEDSHAGHPSDSAEDRGTGFEATMPGTGVGEAYFLLFLGVVFTFGGMALALGPKFSWKVEQISQGLAYLGVHGGTLLIGGLLLASVGLVRRAQSIAAEEQTSGFDELLMERVAGDVVQMRNSLDHLARSVDAFDSKIERVTKEVREIEFKMPRPEPEPAQEVTIDPGQMDAIFRLAASVDHVGARIDHRLKAQYRELQDRLEELNALVSQVASEGGNATRGELGPPEAALPQGEAGADEADMEPLLADERLTAAIEDMRRTEKD